MTTPDPIEQLESTAHQLVSQFERNWSETTSAEQLRSVAAEFSDQVEAVSNPALTSEERRRLMTQLIRWLVDADLAQWRNTEHATLPVDYRALFPQYLDVIQQVEQRAAEDIPQTDTVGAPPSSKLPHAEDQRYQFEQELGSGSYCTVYQVKDTRFSRSFAVKVYNRHDGHVKAWITDEAIKLAKLDHPNIVRLLDTFQFKDGRLGFSMELKGQSLRKRVGTTPQPSWEAASIVRQVAEGLAAVHRQGLIHRDIKLDNILYVESSSQAILADFNLAIDAASAADAAVAGSPAYMSPEQLTRVAGQIAKNSEQSATHAESSMNEAAIDHRTDLWSLGVVLYELLTGRRPFDKDGCSRSETVQRILTQSPEAPHTLAPDVPQGLSDICLRCLAKNPNDRFATAAELAAAIDPYSLAVQVKGYQDGATRYFTGREALLQRILANRRTGRPLVLHGLGGTGKSLLACRYAHIHERDFAHILWVTACQSTIDKEFAALARELPGEPMRLSQRPDATDLVRIRAVRDWLSRNPDWLLIFDDAEPEDVGQYLPSTQRGQVLITSRISDWQAIRGIEAVRVDEFTPDEAYQFLTIPRDQDNLPGAKVVDLPASEAAAARALCEALGFLPLALDQAAAYIFALPYKTFAAYLEEVRQHPLQQLTTANAAPTGVTSWSNQTSSVVAQSVSDEERERRIQEERNRRAVATTWNISIERIQATSPRSVELLAVSSFLATAPIPFELFDGPQSYLLLDRDSNVFIQLLTEGWDPSDRDASLPQHTTFSNVLSPLARHSLVRIDYNRKSLSLHTLLKAVVHSTYADGAHSLTNYAAIQLLACAPRDETFARTSADTWLRISPHIIELVGSRLASENLQYELLDTACQCMTALSWHGVNDLMLGQAIETALEGAHFVSPDDRARFMANWARCLADAGRLSHAEAILSQAVSLDEEGDKNVDISNLVTLARVKNHKYRDLQGAQVLAERAINLVEGASPTDVNVCNAVSCWHWYGQFCIATGHLSQARMFLEKARRAADGICVDKSLLLTALDRADANLLIASGECERGVGQLKELFAREEAMVPTPSPLRYKTAVLIAHGLGLMGVVDETIKWQRTALQLVSDAEGESSIATAIQMTWLGECLREVLAPGRSDVLAESISLLTRAVEIFDELGESDGSSARFARTRLALARSDYVSYGGDMAAWVRSVEEAMLHVLSEMGEVRSAAELEARLEALRQSPLPQIVNGYDIQFGADRLDAEIDFSNVTTQMSGDNSGADTAGSASRTKPNAPCPCGSGKKYKKCCGRG